MNPYPAYKDVVLNGLGEIPDGWNTKRISHFFVERKETVDDRSYPPLSVTMKGIQNQLKGVAKTDNNDNRKKVCYGDFVINSRSDRKGSSGISFRDGSVSVINTVLEPISIHPLYVHYLLRSYHFTEEFFRHGKGIYFDLWSTKYSIMKNIEIPVMSFQEQQQISNYLDNKIHQIDSLMEKTQQKIELLKQQRTSLINQVVTKGLDPNVEMKDSEVEWLGVIPFFWNVDRLKFGIDLIESGKRESVEFSEILSIGGEHVGSDGKLRLENLKYVSEEFFNKNAKGRVSKGDILVVKDGATIGKAAYVDNAYKQRMLLNEHVYRIVSHKYDYYYILSSFFQASVWSGNNSSAQEGLNSSTIRNIPHLILSNEEKEKISNYLDNKTHQIDSLIENETQRIALLKEYRQSSIINL